ncbi:hypothetical protein A3F65_02090 [Candidatus Saccharibacteria bacterium RIFCSPHIGHO2_12_FULL_47_16b]|nr:MAG: hypothetical protein A3F65_02090 [Candidatus Saccharibacteria bacterium RIFCSPHIGHO2_12_FULL_47_16b]OGL39844.1 MAG: hypothetical protein A3J32_02175 [Candidatus Saccharibacteria bacterium RIFCSPLOWO2_02_FULL_46_7]
MMKLVDTITIAELTEMAEKMYGQLVKAVVDTQKNLLVVDGELHSDQEAYLLEKGSDQKNLWGINLYPEKFGKKDFIEFDSMINIRPSQKNMSKSVEDQKIRRQIFEIVEAKVAK